MKIRVTLDVSDDARRCIAENLKNSGAPYLAIQDGRATRATVISWLQQCCRQAHVSHQPVPKVDPLDREETARAVAQLRALGWSDARIKSWLLKNAALLEGANLKLWDSPLLSTYDAPASE
jgi:hypothetical protein